MFFYIYTKYHNLFCFIILIYIIKFIGGKLLKEIIYNRDKAIEYAQKWALKRNPRYFDFSNFGGDCTNFVSQCIYAGCGVMNYTPTFGWYYNSSYSRSPSWSGVEYLYNFFTTNKNAGPYATEVAISNIEIGDVIQLGDKDFKFYHTLFVTKIDTSPSAYTIYVSSHSYDAKNRLLDTYTYSNIRYLHIDGVR